MSEQETAQTGAPVAPAQTPAPPEPQQQDTAPNPTTEQTSDPNAQQTEGQPRDEQGRFVPQARVNEITRARREAERRAAALEQELQSYRQQGGRQQPAQPSPQDTQDRVPTLAEHNYDVEAYTAAMTQYAVRQANAAAEQRFTQQQHQHQQQQVVQQFEERSRVYAAAHPDYEQSVTELAQSVQFPAEIVEAIGLSEHGPAVAHYLAQHLDEADRISRMPPYLAAVQLGRIEAQVGTQKPTSKPVSGAPTPPPTLSGGKSTVSKDPDDLPIEEWVARRNAQLKK